MSVALSLSSPRACSGDQYSGVPSSIPWVVTLVDDRAMPGEPEVGDDDAARRTLDQHVPGREVAMDDPAGVRVGERRRDR